MGGYCIFIALIYEAVFPFALNGAAAFMTPDVAVADAAESFQVCVPLEIVAIQLSGIISGDGLLLAIKTQPVAPAVVPFHSAAVI